ncbi:MAG: 6-carboxytetrahydropterin synthase QueD [Chitinispirillaceae bacterium]|jgi:6-pyruvoyltetrahydropterin/6-carboxytetrahydropterin synthase|nr:6-carboxytetrahydropterin synthase QueD [Chitinispirillaceae bacterium]
MYEITVESSFSAAHRLNHYCGACENLHGHNWLVKAIVRCETLDAAGIGIDFRVLKTHLRDIISDFDHKDLNAVLDPLNINPSSENISRMIFERLEKSLAGWNGSVYRVEVNETPGSCAAYFK